MPLFIVCWEVPHLATPNLGEGQDKGTSLDLGVVLEGAYRSQASL